MTRKIWALLLTVIMVVTMMPIGSFADEQGGAASASAQQITSSSEEMMPDETLENGDVKINKSIKGTDTENVFKVTLDVTTVENLEKIPTTADAAVVLVIDRSGSMNNEVDGSQGKKTRLQAAKDAAYNFVDKFGEGAKGSKRLVQIVQFSSDAVRGENWGWENVAVESGLAASKSDIGQIDDPAGGTNIEGGLQLAYNLIKKAETDKTLEKISNVNVILLTDGCPTYHVTEKSRNSIDIVEGDRGGGIWAQWKDHNSVTTQDGIANKIKNHEVNGGKVSLYSIAFSTGTAKFAVNDQNDFGKAKKQNVYEWLSSFSSKAFNSENPQELYNSFGKIVSIIKLGAKAWFVHDPMASNIIYKGNDSYSGVNTCTFSKNKLLWDLKKSQPDVVTSGSKTLYHYSFTYPVALDTTAADFAFDTAMATNGETILDYFMFSKADKEGAAVELKHADFDVPEVKGLCGSLEFMKADEKDNPVKGAVFTLKGTAVGTDKLVTMTAESGSDGKVSFANIPPGTYKLKETKVPAGYTGDSREYDVKVSYGKVTSNLPESGKVTNTREKTAIAVDKKWIDGEDQDELRPDSIMVRLKANGVGTGDAITLNADNDWTYEWNDLDKFSYNSEGVKGEAVLYTVEEVDVPEGYVAAVSGDAENGFTITNTIKQNTVTVKGTKTWIDPEGTVHPDITINLLQNGKSIDSLVLKNGETSYEFTGLDKYDSKGYKYSYNVEEKNVKGYTTSYVNKDGDCNIINTIEQEKIEINGIKTWIDPQGTEHENVTIELYRDGKKVGETVIKSGENSYSFTDLDKYDLENGHEYEYTVKEQNVEGYEASYDKYNITNTIKQEKISIEGTKTWKDPEGTEHPSIKINLLQDGEEIDDIELSNGRTEYAFTGLDKYDLEDGHVYEYTVTEDPVEGYTTVKNDNNFVNTIAPGNMTISGVKTWIAPEGTIYPAVKIILLQNGTEYKSVELANGEMEYSFDVPVYDGEGQPYKYEIKEADAEGYTSKVDGYNVTNTIKQEYVDVTGTKTWIAPEGTEFPDAKIDLCRDGKVIDSAELKSGESKYSFRTLDKYDLTDGHVYEYTVLEQTVEGYSPSYDGYDITNIINQKYVTVSGTKSWVAPEGTEFPDITVNLMKNGEEVDEVVLRNGTTDFSFENLEQYSYSNDGTVTMNDYTITEDAVNGYKSTIEGYNITNTKNPDTVIPDKPKTGDDFNMWIFAALALTAAAGAGAAVYGRRRKQR